MKVGIIGMPASGKTTIFNAVTGASAEVHSFAGATVAEPNIGVVNVPDDRQDWLVQLYKPKKNVYATIDVIDVAGLVPGQSQKDSSQFINHLRQVDALVHVVRLFTDPSVPHASGSVDGMRDAELLELELVLTDLALVDKRLEKLDAEIMRKKGQERTLAEAEKELLVRLRQSLSSEQPLRQLELTEEEEKLIRGFTFLSLRPMLIVANMDEQDIGNESGNKTLSRLAEFAREKGMPFVAVCGKIEMEIAQLDEAERAEYLQAMGIKHSSRERLIKATYDLLAVMPFFTVGEDEVKAWTITRGTIAQEAARKIHSDIARGFIRAEVCPFDALRSCGTWHAAKEKGLVRLEGKEYVVQDGDCINFRFAV